MDVLALAVTGLIVVGILLGIIWRQKQRVDYLNKWVVNIATLCAQTSQDLNNVEYFLVDLSQEQLNEYGRVAHNVRPFRARARDEQGR